jgi:hypothetical protein
MATDTGKSGDEHILAERDGRCKADQVDVETVLIPAVSYSTGEDSVHLHLSTAEDNATPTSKGGTMLKAEVKDIMPLACVLRETV